MSSGGPARKRAPEGALVHMDHQICQTRQVPSIHGLLISSGFKLDPGLRGRQGGSCYYSINRMIGV